jgi:CNT family concentrative nucleoside transporter
MMGGMADLALRVQSLFGLFVFVGLMGVLGYALARRRRAGYRVPWRVVIGGMGLQFVFAVLVLRVPLGGWLFEKADAGVRELLTLGTAGARLLFGDLAKTANVPVGVPADPTNPGFSPILEPTQYAQIGAIFAFNVLPAIVFFASLLALLYHLGVMRPIVGGIAWVMRRTLGTGGAETLCAAANVFVGQTEAPLFVRPYLAGMSRSSLHALMVGGFANIASGVLAVYSGILGDAGLEGAGGHLLAASLISAPAGLAVAKLLLPETTGDPDGPAAVVAAEGGGDANFIDAAARGAIEGGKLALTVAAMIIAFLGLIALANGLLTVLPDVGGAPLTIERMLGWLLAPAAWLCGVPWGESASFGSLLGIKTVLNEFLAYIDLAADVGAGEGSSLSERSQILAVYALCGFANFGSVAIQIGGISTLAPGRRRDLAELAVLAMIGGTVASLMTACVVGVVL